MPGQSLADIIYLFIDTLSEYSEAKRVTCCIFLPKRDKNANVLLPSLQQQQTLNALQRTSL